MTDYKTQALHDIYRRQYVHFLKYTNPNKAAKFDAAPDNLLELLDNAHRRYVKYKQLIERK
jgi:hypothetical protein